jgi:hypothetical protein
MSDLRCQAPACANPVPRNPRGRPALYCCAQCRPSSRNARGVVVEIEHPQTCTDGRAPERVWTVRLRRGNRSVVIADALGWPSANALATDLSNLLERPNGRKGADID